MPRTIPFALIAVFSIFLGSQLTEGYLLVPYWKSLPAAQFYQYYAEFGPVIGRFYTVLTLLAALVPLGLSLYCYMTKAAGLRPALVATGLALLVIGSFYAYFKGANQQFYDMVYSPDQLKVALETWAYWHWARVLLEVLSLASLIMAFAAKGRSNKQA